MQVLSLRARHILNSILRQMYLLKPPTPRVIPNAPQQQSRKPLFEEVDNAAPSTSSGFSIRVCKLDKINDKVLWIETTINDCDSELHDISTRELPKLRKSGDPRSKAG